MASIADSKSVDVFVRNDDSDPPTFNRSAVKNPLSHSFMPRVLSKPVSKPMLEPEPDTMEIEAGNREVSSESGPEVEDPPIVTLAKEPPMEIGKTQPTKKQAEELWRAIRAMGPPEQQHESRSKGSENVKASSRTLSSKVTARPKSTRKMYEESSLMQMSFDKRMGHFINKQKENAVTLAIEMLANKQSQCTFTPRINGRTKRNFNEFLHDQERFRESRAARIENSQLEAREKELLQMQTPRMDPKSLSLLSTKKGGRSNSVHKHSCMYYKAEEEENKSCVKKEKPAKSRNKSMIGNKSCDLTQRSVRMTSIKKKREESRLLEEQKKEELNRSSRKIKENAFVQSKITRELDQIFDKYDNQKITPSIMCAVLREFGMVRDSKEEQLANMLFDKLKLKANNGEVERVMVADAILAIMRIGNIEKKEYIEEMHNEFKLYYINRMTYQKPVERRPDEVHAPKLDPKSVKLAEKAKAKRLQLIDDSNRTSAQQNLTLIDLLMVVKKAQEKQVNAERTKKQAEEDKRCTFRPAILNNTKATATNKSKKSKKPTATESINKCMSLYQLAKLAKKPNKVKSKEQREYEKQKDELTFAPRLYKMDESCLSSNVSQRSTYRKKGIESSVERIRKARNVSFPKL